jgi:hypothetical protein
MRLDLLSKSKKPSFVRQPIKGLGWMDTVGDAIGPWILLCRCGGLLLLPLFFCFLLVMLLAKGCNR